MKKHIHLILIIAILAVGIFVRVYDFGKTPDGLNQDEASLGYDAWADMNYGMDRNGDHNPIYAVAWGSGQNMLYNYVTRPFITIMGLTVVSVRLPMLLFGIASLILFYFIVKELFDKDIALLALFLMAICPWHIMLCRWGLESNFVVPISMFALYCFIKSLQNGIWFIPAMIFTALCMYAYSAILAFLIIFVPAILIYFIVKKMVQIKYILIGIGSFLVISLPMLMFLIVNQFDLEPMRFLWFSIPKFPQLRSIPTIPILYNKTEFWRILSDNIMHLKQILITMNDGHITTVIEQYGAIYKFMIPFMVLGLIILFAKRNNKLWIILIWILCGLVYCLFVDLILVRMNFLLAPMLILAALGMHTIFKKIKGSIYVALIISILAFMSFSGYYFSSYNENSQWDFSGSLGDALKIAYEPGGTVYCVNGYMNSPYMTSLFTMKDPPNILVDAVHGGGDTQFNHIERYGCFVDGLPDKIISGDAYIFRTVDGLPEEMSYLNLDDFITFEKGAFTVAIVK